MLPATLVARLGYENTLPHALNLTGYTIQCASVAHRNAQVGDWGSSLIEEETLIVSAFIFHFQTHG